MNPHVHKDRDLVIFARAYICGHHSVSVAGHSGQLAFGKLGGKTVVCMKGRIHAYEGHSMWKVSDREFGVVWDRLLCIDACLYRTLQCLVLPIS